MNSKNTDDAWVDLFVIELRLRHVSGRAIGDAVATVRELLNDSGETAEEAFGTPREYADALGLASTKTASNRIRMLLVPVVSLIAFIFFSLALTRWFASEDLYFSPLQLVFLAVPVVLSIAFSFPFYPRMLFRQEWMPALMMLVAAASGVLAAVVAPASPDEAWVTTPALPVILGCVAAMIILSIIGTIATLRSRDGEQIIAPLEALSDKDSQKGLRGFTLFVNWLFPILTVVLFLMLWGMHAVRG